MSKSEQETVDCKEMFELALSAMKRVTEMVNEGTRLFYKVPKPERNKNDK